MLDPFSIVIQISRSLLVAYYQETFIDLREELKLMWSMIIWETIAKKKKKKTFMGQDPDWTSPDNSLNMELYYKNHLHLIENGNMKFSKSTIETLQNVLSPQSSQSSSSYLSQSSLIRSPQTLTGSPHFRQDFS